jgi:ketosteroid isomerase-like protein
MSGPNRELLDRIFDAFGERDKAAWSELVDPDVETIPVGLWPEAELRGNDAVWDFLVSTEEPWEPGRYELSEVVEAGDHLVARLRRTLRGTSSGAEVEYDYWIAVTFRRGLMLRAQWFNTGEEALAAAGLEP